jgi:DNA polymerase I-like protein with 3'-5' exonuclease and polymerase domains
VASPDPQLYWSDNYVVIDFETTTIHKGSPLVEGNRLVLASWFDNRTGQIKSHFGSEFEMGDLVASIEGADFIVAHNAKFELGWLKRCGLDLRKVVAFDTIIAEHVLGGNRYFIQQLGLNACLIRRGLEQKEDTVGRMIKGGVCPSEIPASWLQKYCERDVMACHELFLDQRKALFDAGQGHLIYQRCLVTPALVDMEFNGLQLDKEIIDELTKEIEDRYAQSTSELQEFCGGVPPTSPRQLATFVYDQLRFTVPRDHRGRPMRTPKGEPSVAAEVMDRLRPTNSTQRTFLDKYLEWKELDTKVTKYLRKFQHCCDTTGGRLLGSFNQCNTRTHRFSSSGLVDKIQLQNLDRNFKKFFTTRERGWLVGEIDGAQLEFRIAVHMGRDPVGLRNITTPGFDVHALTAQTLGVSRQEAKPFTFKPLYGGIGGTPEQMAYFEAFKATYTGVATTQRRWVLECLDKKQFTTEYGLSFYFPFCKLTSSGWITHTTNIYNYPVQGFATAEIIPIALVCAWHRMANWNSFLVNTVHDSIIAELHPSEVEAWHELARTCFISDTYSILRSLYGIELTVPLGATGRMTRLKLAKWSMRQNNRYILKPPNERE